MVPVVAALPAHLRCYFVEVAAWRDTALAARRSPDLAPAIVMGGAKPRVVASDRVARDRMVTAQRHGLERARAQASALGAQAAHAVDPETARRLRRASIIAAYNARHLEHELAR